MADPDARKRRQVIHRSQILRPRAHSIGPARFTFVVAFVSEPPPSLPAKQTFPTRFACRYVAKISKWSLSTTSNRSWLPSSLGLRRCSDCNCDYDGVRELRSSRLPFLFFLLCPSSRFDIVPECFTAATLSFCGHRDLSLPPLTPCIRWIASCKLHPHLSSSVGLTGC